MELEHFESLYPETARFTEIEKLLSFIKEGNSCQLIGLPGVGRGTLLGLCPTTIISASNIWEKIRNGSTSY